MKIGIVETGEVPADLLARHGDYPAMFERLLGGEDPSLKFLAVRVITGERLPAPDSADAWLVTGSRHGVYDALPWMAPLAAFLRDCIAARVPVVGVCFGHQILAEALGGRVEKSDRGWGVGVQDYTVVVRPSWLADAPDVISVGAMHQDQIVEMPRGAVVLAHTVHCPHAVLAYGDPERPDAISLQPHPEFDADFLDALIAMRAGDVIPADVARAARASLARPMHRADWARWILAYLRKATRA